MILDVLSGNRDAYAEIVRKYENRVRGYCRMMLADSSLADDAAQEIFIKAYQALARFNGRSSFSTWLYRISVNHCTDLLRKSARGKTESWEALLEKEGDRIEGLLIAEPKLEASDQIETVLKFFSCLPEKTREILTLREAQGLSYQEIASVLNCSLDAVKSRLKRARQEIGEKLRHFLTSQASK